MSAEGAESRSTVGKVLWVALPLIVGGLLTLFQGKAEQAGRMDNLENRIAAHESLSLSSVCRQVERLEGTGVQLAQARTALDAQVVALTERVRQVESRPASLGLEPETPASLAKLRADLDRIRESLALLGPLSERVTALEREDRTAPPPQPDPALRQGFEEQAAGLAKLKARVDGAATREALEALSQRVAQLGQQLAQVRQPPPPAPRSAGAQPPAPEAPPSPTVAVLQSQRKGGVRLDITSITADGAHLVVDFLATSERRDAELRLSAPSSRSTRAITALGVELGKGAFDSPRNEYRSTEVQLVADVPTRVRLYLECAQAAPVQCSALVVGMQVDAGPPGWPHEFVDHEVTFRNLVASEP